MERFAYGIAAASALVMAACLSGMPSTTCAAMAETYQRAIGGFGGAALAAVGMALYTTTIAPWIMRHIYHNEKPPAWRNPLVNAVLVLLVGGYFMTYAFASVYNLNLATGHCYIGEDADIAARLHRRIELAGPFSSVIYRHAFFGD